MNLEDWGRIATIVQSFAFVLAVMIGGIWAVFRFRAMNELTRSKLELSRIQKELEQRSRVQLHLSTEVIQGAVEVGSVILATVTLSNVGNRGAVIDVGDTFMFVASVNDVNGSLSYDHEVPILPAVPPNCQTLSIEAGVVEQLQFAIPASKRGLYRLRFRAPAAADSSAALLVEHQSVAPVTRVSFGVVAFIHV